MKKITLDELRRMNNNEGLILQGCGGDLDEWVAEINKHFTEEGILLDGDTFKDIFVFEHDGHTNLLFHMDDVKLNIGKLAMWKLLTHQNFGGYWLSDYVPNRLGGFVDGQPQEREKPNCPLIGADGNIFNLMGIAARTLKDNGMKDEAAEMRQRVMDSGSYLNATAPLKRCGDVSLDGDKIITVIARGRCECQVLKNGLKTPISVTWCHCCKGSILSVIKYIFPERKCKMIIKETIVSGGGMCLFVTIFESEDS